MKKYIMALDQGTTSSRCIIFDKKGNIVAKAQKEFTQYYPEPGWVEHDPMEIWSTQIGVAHEALHHGSILQEAIAAIGITNQRETTVVWDKTSGEPVAPAIVWQCRRTAPYCEELINQGYGKMIKAKTGLLIDPYFSGTKIKWILDNTPGAREKAVKGELLFGTIDSWLIWKLTQGKIHATDYSNASRTMLFNINTLEWDEELLQLLDIPKDMLPEVRPSSGDFGSTGEEIFSLAIPIGGVVGDQQGALFGQACFEQGMAKNTYGTGCFMLLNTGEKPVTSQNGLLTTIAWGYEGKITYALEGSVFVAGAAIQWLRDELQLITAPEESEVLANQVKDTNGVYLVPSFVGLGAPHWDSEARGIITGLTRGANRCHIVRAALEAMAYQTADVLTAMTEDSNLELLALKVDGGAAANNFLLQFQADIINTQVERPSCLETTALGAAYLGGLAVGYWRDTQEIAANWRRDSEFCPNMADTQRKELLAGWNRAVKKTLTAN